VRFRWWARQVLLTGRMAASQLGRTLRFAHLFPNADPNRLANLVSLMREAHIVASRAEAEFVRTLAGRAPTQAEVMAPP